MTKLTKRIVDSLKPRPTGDVFAWDQELRGFGVRVKPNGLKTYLIQYRNTDGRTRRLVLGKHGILTSEQARGMAQQKLAGVARGDDPSADRHKARESMTVAEICDWYLDMAQRGRLIGRNRTPIKASTLAMDRSRIEVHIKPLLGARSVRGLTRADIERLQADVAEGRTAKRRVRRGGHTTGGAGVAGRTAGTLRSLLNHAKRWGLIEANPAEGVRLIASQRRVRHLGGDELRHLGKVMRKCAADGEHPVGLAAIRFLLLTGFRRMEVLTLQRAWVDKAGRCVRFPDTKSGPQIRVIGQAALDLILAQPTQAGCPFVFPSDRGEGHFVGLPLVLKRVCERAELEGVTAHVLRHTFASVAAELEFSELTIAAMLGHGPRGVTQRYIHIDAALKLATDRVAQEIAQRLNGAKALKRTA